MLLHCDLVYVAETAKLSAPFVNLGLVPEAASSMLLPARIGHVRAFAMFALGESISGAEAVALGLANKMLPQDEVLTAARSAAKALAKKPAGSVVSTKRLMRDVAALLARIDEESLIFGERLKSDEAREAFRAFVERRPPDFSKFTS
jgi:enoyl-CoA hydratase/carnithine racemase